MKTIFSLLLLPVMVFAQPLGQHQKERFNLEFSVAFAMESILKNEMDILPKNIDDAMEIFITVEIYLEELIASPMTLQFADYETVGKTPPQYLNTYSLVGLYPMVAENRGPQKRLAGLLALNDPQFPKEDTLFDWLRPVRYQQNKLGGAERMPEGFGPRIQL
jgi:hypothetical protein